MFLTFRERFEKIGLSTSFEFVAYNKHKCTIGCKNCGALFYKWDDFLRRSKHGKVTCPSCKKTNKYTAPEFEKRQKEPYAKKGYHTPEAEAARKKETERRRQQGETNYRQKFEALGLDFTFLRREWSQERDRRFWIRCNRCGAEFLRYNDIFKGRVKSVICRNCGNGTAQGSEFASEVLDYYSKGRTARDTAEKFGITTMQVDIWARGRHVSNGRTLSEINTEKARISATKAIERTGEKLKARLDVYGFVLLGKYKGRQEHITIKCKACGEVYERNPQNCMKFGAACPNCKAIRSAEALRIREQAHKAELEKKKAEKLAANPLGLSAYQLEREKVLDVPHVCKVCGKEYTIRSYMQSIGTSYKRDSGYCSKACREKQKHINERANRKKARAEGRRYCCRHYTRAKRLGLPAEEGITKAKLLKRDGPFCALCFLPLQTDGDPKSDLYWSIDHIVPMHKGGGHTWDNVQLAHRLCNSNKRDLVGKRWNNGND